MAFTVSLNGANYVSTGRQEKFLEALEKEETLTLPADHQPSRGGASQARHAQAQESTPRVADAPPVADTPPQQPAPAQANPPAAQAPASEKGRGDYGRVLASLEQGLSHSFNHQTETLRVHEQYLSNESSYAAIFAQLMQQQGDLVAQGVASPQQLEATVKVLQSLSRSLEQFHQHQTETLDVHGRFLQQQSAYAQAFVDLLQSHYGEVLHGNGHGNGHNGNGHHGGNGNGNGNGNGHHDTALSSATAYAPETAAPVAAPPQPEAATMMPDPVPVVTEPAPEVQREDAAVREAAAPAPSAAPAVDAEALAEALLEIVSDKTGYPAEMLELDMDMEADLGIDSIKRVEILGALQDRYPDLPEVAPDDLAELRTLAQVIEYTSAQVNAPASNPPAVEEQDAAPATEPDEVPPVAPAADTAALAQDLLDIVSDKTGYPAEMLELEMDMEADLGIDSIKRVEILGALQDEHPDLPEVAADDLAELRTLGQVIDYMNAGVAEKKV
jgi:acyl carrier protein